MKTLYVRVPFALATELMDQDKFNTSYITEVINEYMNEPEELYNEPFATDRYIPITIKIDKEVHKELKIKSFELGLPMSSIVGRMVCHYMGGNIYG